MIDSKAAYYYYLQQDKKALKIKHYNGISGKLREILSPNLIWRFERLMRRLEYLANVEMKSSNYLLRSLGGAKYVYYMRRYRSLSMKLGFSIPINVFGPGLSIAHYGTIVVNGATRVGANCRIHAGVNIGASAGQKVAPIIGDNVYIGPGAIIFGDIHITNNITIGANATVNKSFESPNIVIAGTPAKVVKEGYDNWLIFNHVE